MNPEYRLIRRSNGDYELEVWDEFTRKWNVEPTVIEQEPLRDHESENGGPNK